MANPKTAINVVFGVMTFGEAGNEGVRVSSLEDAGAMLDAFTARGHKEIDNARVYGGGTSEQYLGALDWQKRGLVMETKLYPMKAGGVFNLTYNHKPEELRKFLMESLTALKTDKIDMWYLHGPDRSVPYEDTLREVNNLYKEGFFSRFGISNYMSWEVAQICEICKKNGWIQPTVYQGIYNALHRGIEPELFPCLRYYGISLYCFQPLAGGFLADRYQREGNTFEEGSRFDPNRRQGKLSQGRYFHDDYFDALDVIRPVIKKHNLTMAECAMRWLLHHSQLSREKNDSIIIGASSLKQLNENLDDLEKGPLPEDVVKAIEEGWLKVKGSVPRYFH